MGYFTHQDRNPLRVTGRLVEFIRLGKNSPFRRIFFLSIHLHKLQKVHEYVK